MDTWFETRAGTVRRALVDGVRAFLGVPYGASTAGEGRFRAPRPVEPWDGARDALDYGPSSWQRSADGAEQVEVMRQMLAPWGGIPEPSMSEDCLVLNVWAPVDAAEPLQEVILRVVVARLIHELCADAAPRRTTDGDSHRAATWSS